MRAAVDAGRADPLVRSAVLSALRDSPEKDPRSELAALLDYVREHMRYTRDPVDVEYVQTPRHLLETIRREGVASGDCDDSSILYASLAEAAGYPTRFLAVGPEGDTFSHVLVEVDTDNGWVPVDPSQRVAGVGYRPRVGVGREARTMGLGQDVYVGVAEQSGYAAGPATVSAEGITTVDLGGGIQGMFQPTSEVQPAPAPAPTDGGASDFWGSILSSVSKVATAALPLAERYGALRPVVGYDAQGRPIYAGATLPVSGAQGAAYTWLTQPTLGGLTGGQLLLLGGAVVLLLVVMPGGRRR